jgi:hypothetical protein
MVTKPKKKQTEHQPGPDELTLEEGWELLNARTQRYLGISGKEFLQRWDAGYYDDDPDREELRPVVGVIGFAR